jgi:hypothetical protein
MKLLGNTNRKSELEKHGYDQRLMEEWYTQSDELENGEENSDGRGSLRYKATKKFVLR